MEYAVPDPERLGGRGGISFDPHFQPRHHPDLAVQGEGIRAAPHLDGKRVAFALAEPGAISLRERGTGDRDIAERQEPIARLQASLFRRAPAERTDSDSLPPAQE